MPICLICACTCRPVKVIWTPAARAGRLLVFAEPPWPADMQVYELASERIGWWS